MRKHFSAALVLSAALAVSAQEVAVPRHDGGRISAAALENDGTGWLAISQGGSAHLYRFTGDSFTPAATFAGIVKSVRTIGSGALLVTGAEQGIGGGHPFFRLVDQSPWKVVWDSRSLPGEIQSEEFLVNVSPSGRRWAALSSHDDRAEISFGSTGGYRPATTVRIEAEKTEYPAGFVYDGLGVEFFDDDNAVILWRGRAYVISDGKEVRRILAAPHGAASLQLDRSSGAVWMVNGSVATRFSDDASDEPDRVRRSPDEHAVFFALTGGRSGFVSRRDGLLRFDRDEQAPLVVRVTNPRARIVPNGDGTALFVLPDGELSKVVRVQR